MATRLQQARWCCHRHVWLSNLQFSFVEATCGIGVVQPQFQGQVWLFSFVGYVTYSRDLCFSSVETTRNLSIQFVATKLQRPTNSRNSQADHVRYICARPRLPPPSPPSKVSYPPLRTMVGAYMCTYIVDKTNVYAKSWQSSPPPCGLWWGHKYENNISNSHSNSNRFLRWDNIAEIILHTDYRTLAQINPRQKRNYIRQTWNLIEQRQRDTKLKTIKKYRISQSKLKRWPGKTDKIQYLTPWGNCQTQRKNGKGWKTWKENRNRNSSE